jgi:hypothetical protein
MITAAFDDLNTILAEDTQGALQITNAGRSGKHGIIYPKNNSDNVISLYLGYLFDFDIEVPLSTPDEEYGPQDVDFNELGLSIEDVLVNIHPTELFSKFDATWNAQIKELEEGTHEEPIEDNLQPDLPGLTEATIIDNREADDIRVKWLAGEIEDDEAKDLLKQSTLKSLSSGRGALIASEADLEETLNYWAESQYAD